jgi:8-oxo-dGTP diphosphatase
MTGRVARYCPRCGGTLHPAARFGRERPVCADCDFVVYHDPKVAALAFAVQDERLLLVQRALEPQQGLWACPAGFVDYDEAPADAVLRELHEETGLTGQVIGLLEVFPRHDHGLADIVICYAVAITGGQLAAADDAADAGWFPRHALPELAFYPSQALAERWQAGALRL